MTSQDTASEGSNRKTLVFHYKGMLEDGTVFSSTEEGEPFTCRMGDHAIIGALEAELLEMEVGEERAVSVGKAYGEYDQSALQTRILRYTIPNGDALQEGQDVMWTSPQNPNKPVPARIVRADEFTFDIDFNHPLAGHDLTYWVKLLSKE